MAPKITFERFCCYACLKISFHLNAAVLLVAVALHDRKRGVRAALKLRKLLMLWRCRGSLSVSRYAARTQADQLTFKSSISFEFNLQY